MFLQKKRFWSHDEKRWITLTVSARGIRTISKKGIDVVLRHGREIGEGDLDLCFMHGWYAYGGGRGIDQVPGGVEQRHVQGQHVGLAQHLIERHPPRRG